MNKELIDILEKERKVDFQIDEEGFPICKSNNKGKGSDHSRTGGSHGHAPEISKMIFKYPAEEISVGELKKRWKSNSKEGNYRLYCIPPEPDTGLIRWENEEYYSFPSLLNKLGVKNSKGNYLSGQTRAFRYFIEKFVSESKSDMERKLMFEYKNNPGFPIGTKNNNGDEYFDQKILKCLNSSNNVIIEGVAGSGKSHLLELLRRAYYKQEENSKIAYWVAPEKTKEDSEEEINLKESEGFSPLYGENGSQLEVVVFHPSTSYEEFVSGIRPNFMKNEGEGEFVSQEGVFVEICNRAAGSPDKKYLLFIDEINRANTSRVFGDLMLVIEKSKRQEFKDLAEDGRDGALFEASVQKMPGDYVRLQTPIFKNGKEYNKLAVPANLHVLGTMNTTDRSVGTIDLALRRRFHWVTQHPMGKDEDILSALESERKKYGEQEGREPYELNKKLLEPVIKWFIHANKVLKTEVGPDARLGHAYFFGKDGDAKAIAEALITQLLEIIYTFNIKEDVLKKIGLPPIDDYVGSKLDYEGKGLGRRPVVKKLDDKGKSSVTDGGNDSENEGSESTVSDDGQGDQ